MIGRNTKESRKLEMNDLEKVTGGKVTETGYKMFESDEACTFEFTGTAHICKKVGHEEKDYWLFTLGYDHYECIHCHRRFKEWV